MPSQAAKRLHPTRRLVSSDIGMDTHSSTFFCWVFSGFALQTLLSHTSASFDEMMRYRRMAGVP